MGTTAGVASRVVPFDYLVMCTGSSYQSDIKTEGTSVDHRKTPFALERQRIREAEAVTVIGGGLVGRCDLMPSPALSGLRTPTHALSLLLTLSHAFSRLPS